MLAANHKEEMDEWLNEIKKCMEEDQGSTSQRYKQQKGILGQGGGGHSKQFYMGRLAPRSNPLAFYLLLLTGKVTLSCSFHRKFLILVSHTYNGLHCTILFCWSACGSRDGTVVRASHQCGPDSIPGVDVIIMWVEFVFGSCPCSKGFSPGSPVFLPPQKPTFLNSNSTWNAQTPLNEFLKLFGAS